MQMMPRHIFWPIIDCSSLYATGVTRGQGAVLRRIGGRGHFRSRDKDGGQTIRSAIAENPLLYANCTALSFIEPELLPIEVLHCGNREFRIFLRKITENIIFPIHVAKLMQMMPKHIFWPIIDCSSLYATGVTRGQGAVLRKIGGRGHFRSRGEKMAVKPFDPPLPKTPVYANCTALSFIEPELLPIDFFTAQVGIWRIFSNNSGKY